MGWHYCFILSQRWRYPIFDPVVVGMRRVSSLYTASGGHPLPRGAVRWPKL